MNVKQILLKTREILTPPGSWGKGRLRQADGRMCIRGALNLSGMGQAETCSYTSERCLAGKALEEIIDARLGKTLLGCEIRLTSWNDAYDTTHANILTLLDEAIATFPPAEEIELKPLVEEPVLV